MQYTCSIERGLRVDFEKLQVFLQKFWHNVDSMSISGNNKRFSFLQNFQRQLIRNSGSKFLMAS